uniref:Uncharacterized protein n=1 Tax=Penaeus monodon majanivirus B TaxID=2984272 RepID=A0A9C7BPS0_9VIRU|nr:MAG: hypothetical protein [Penaeus monodon majanivirus B]
MADSVIFKNDILLTSATTTNDQEIANLLLQYLQADKESNEETVACPFYSEHYPLPFEETITPIHSEKTTCDDDKHTDELVRKMMLMILQAEGKCIRAIRQQEKVTYDMIQNRTKLVDNVDRISILCDMIKRRNENDNKSIEKMTLLKRARCILYRLCEQKCQQKGGHA